MNNDELKELAAVLNGIADGKKWETQDAAGVWRESSKRSNPVYIAGNGRKIRLKQWHLPDLPEGYEWHRNDWTEEMLSDGWRPLLLGESVEVGDDVWLNKEYGWNTSANGSSIGRNPLHPFARTRRPLPPPKPKLREVQLCADDVKAGDEFLVGRYRHTWSSIKDGYVTYGSGGIYSFEEMMQMGHKIRSVGETEWCKCSKMEEVPS